MDHKIKSILEDLYRIDPSFKQHEKKLHLLVEKLLSAKPNTQFDEQFAMRLRENLMRESAQSFVSPYAHLSVFRWQYSLIVSMVTLLIVIPLTYFGTKTTTVHNVSTGFTMEQQIEEKGSNAFGNLGVIALNSTADSLSSSELSSTTLSLGTEDTTTSTDTLRTTSSTEQGLMKSTVVGRDETTTATSIAPTVPVVKSQASAKMLFPYKFTKYEYKGEPLATTSAQGTVYKRVKTVNTATQLATILNNANFGLLNLGSFSSFKTQSIQVAEDKDFGYVVDINFNEGMISVNPNWEKWQQQGEVKPLTARPTNDQLIAIANTFLAEKGINHSIYGTPVVDEMPVRMYAAKGGNAESTYIPDTMNVVYPLMIGGVEVYEDGGSPYGLTVTVNIRENKVSGVYNISSQTYESAAYDLETDPTKIIAYATSSRMPIYDKNKFKPEFQTANLETPKRILVRHWLNSQNGPTSEVYVPAYMFPVEGEVSFAPRAVIVPLVKSVLEDQGKNNVPPVMPLSKSQGQGKAVGKTGQSMPNGKPLVK